MLSHRAARYWIPVFALAAAACSDERTILAPRAAKARLQAALNEPSLVTFYGPERFARDRGAPQFFIRDILTSGYVAPFVLHVQNGDATGANAVSSGSVTLDGVTLLSESAFNQRGGSWAIPVAVGPSARLSVSLVSAPGSHLDVWLEGQPAAVFCPGGPAGSYESLRDVIDAAPAGGTVFVCDGTWNIDSVVVNKPLTLRSQHPGGATLGDSDPLRVLQGGRPALAIDGVASGLVRIADLGFLMGGRAIIMAGTYDRVEIDSARFYGRDSTTSLGIEAFASTVPTARVDVTNSHFEAMGIGVFPVRNVEFNTRSSTFERFLIAGVDYSGSGTQNSHGRIEDNIFRSCRQLGCIRVVQGGRDVVIARNRLEANASVGAIAAIFVQRGAGQTDRVPLIVEDNEIIGAATTGNPSDTTGWSLAAGIRISDVPSVVNVVRRNRIGGAYAGIRVWSDLDARDNVVSGGVFAFQQLLPRAVTIHRNDFTGQPRSFTAPNSGGNYRCNWWGSTSGPPNPPTNVPAQSYAPWAMQPIAATPVECDPTPPSEVRVCATSVDGGPFTVPTLAQAVSLVADGGTVTLCDGTHHASSVPVVRSVTIMAEGPGIPTIDGDGVAQTIAVWNDPSASALSVGIRGLRFVNAATASVSVGSQSGTVTIEQSEFHPTETVQYGGAFDGYASGIRVSGAVGGVIIRGNTFLGGDIGALLTGGPAGVLVSGNHFNGQTNAGVSVFGSPAVRIEGNDFTNCGLGKCMWVQHAAGAQIVANTIVIPYARPTYNTIYVMGSGAPGSYTVTDNVIAGVGNGGSGDRNDWLTYPIQVSGIQVDGEAVTISRNRITNAYGGINLTPVNSASGTDNVITHVNAPFLAGGSPATSTATFTRNDITDYVQATLWAGFASADLRCNWWGSVTGPLHPEWLQPTTLVSPWATQPIANQPAVVCTP